MIRGVRLELFLALLTAGVMTSDSDTAVVRVDNRRGISFSRFTMGPIVFVSLVEPPFLINTTQRYPGAERSYSGFIPDLVHNIAQRMGRPYRMRLVEYAGYGVPDTNADGGWTGLVGDVLTGRADVAAAPMTITSTRRNVVNFTIPFLQTGIVAVYYSHLTSGWAATIESPLSFIDKDIEMVCISGSLTHYYIESERLRSTTVGHVIRQMLMSRPLHTVWTREQGKQRVIASRGTSVFFVEKPFGEYLVATDDSCRLKATTSYLNRRKYAFAVRKYYESMTPLNNAIESLQSDGTITKLYNKWWHGKCSPSWGNPDADTDTKDSYTYQEPDQVMMDDVDADDKRASHYVHSGSRSVFRAQLCCVYLAHSLLHFIDFL